MLKKKSYFLSIDALVAVVIIILGVIIIYSQFSYSTYDLQHEIYSDDLLNSMILFIPEYNVNFYEQIRLYKEQNVFDFPTEPMSEAIARLIVKHSKGCNNCLNISRNITRDIIENRIPDIFSINVTLSNQSDTFLLYNFTSQRTPSIVNAKTISVSDQIIAVIEDDEFHSFILKVMVWS